MTKVFVFVEGRLFTDALTRALRQYPDMEVLLHNVATGTEAADTILNEAPHVVLLDYVMPEMDGPTVTRTICRRLVDIKVLLLSAVHGPDQVQAALDAGAVGFLPKSLCVPQIVDAIRQARDGHPLVYAEELAGLVEDISWRAQQAEQQWNRLMTLTTREVEILQLLSEGRPPKQVARDLSITGGTLKNYVHSILSKTGARTRMNAIDIAHAEGLISKRRPGPFPDR